MRIPRLRYGVISFLVLAAALVTAAPAQAFNGAALGAAGEALKSAATLVQKVQQVAPGGLTCRPGRWIVLDYAKAGMRFLARRNAIRRTRIGCSKAKSSGVWGLVSFHEPSKRCYMCAKSDLVRAGVPGTPGVAGGGNRCKASAQTSSPLPTFNFVTQAPINNSAFQGSRNLSHVCITEPVLRAWLKKNPGTVILAKKTTRCPNPTCLKPFHPVRIGGGALLCVACSQGSYSVKYNCCI